MSEPSLGLSEVALPQLEQARKLVAEQSLKTPLSEAALKAAGLGHSAEAMLNTLTGLGEHAVLAALDLVIAERVHRRPPRLKLIWTGPEDMASTAGDTALVVRSLFKDAQREVLIAGFAFDHGEEIFAPLHAAMKTRGVKTTLFIDIRGYATTTAEAEACAEAQIQAFLEENWPFGEPFPAVYYDPRTAMKGPPWVSLHAKCVVVDEKVTFATSANFTERAQERNTELGVRIEDEEFARKVAGQWWGLVRSGVVTRNGAPPACATRKGRLRHEQ